MTLPLSPLRRGFPQHFRRGKFQMQGVGAGYGDNGGSGAGGSDDEKRKNLVPQSWQWVDLQRPNYH